MTHRLETATKFDEDKLRFDLIPPEALEALAAVLGYGAVKYDAWNWAKGGGLDPERVYGALQRHLNAIRTGEYDDPETGFPHTWHALTNAAFLVALETRGRNLPDRSGDQTFVREGALKNLANAIAGLRAQGRT